jgi:TolB-like protein
MTRLYAVLVAVLILSPATLSHAQATQPAHSRQRVLVLPFAPTNDADKFSWMGRSIQQNLLGDLVMSREIDVVGTSVTTAPADTRAALDEAKRADADFVVFGSYQVVDPEVRITGQVLNARHDEPALAHLRSTGTVRELFK